METPNIWLVIFNTKNGMYVCVFQRWVLYGVMQQYVLPWFQIKCGPHALHTKVEADLKSEREWPPLSDPQVSDMQRSSGTGKQDILYVHMVYTVLNL